METLQLVFDAVLIALLCINFFQRKNKATCEHEQEDYYDPWISVRIWDGEGGATKDATPHLLRKEDIVSVRGRAVPGCEILTKQGDLFVSPEHYDRVTELLRN